MNTRTLILSLLVAAAASADAQYMGGIGSGATVTDYSASARLPLTLLYFDGRPEDGTVVLDWATVNEIDTDHFVVERTVDGMKFTPVGQLAAAGTATPGRTLSYTLTDADPILGTAIYRLKSVDLDGTVYYSDLVEIGFGEDVPALSFDISPNPGTGTLIGLDLGSISGDENISVEVMDPAGRLLVSRHFFARPGERVELRLNDRLPAGSYLLRLSQPTAGSHTERLIVGQSR